MVHTIPGRLKLVTAPASEPVTTAEAKSHLRIETAFTADDTYIDTLIKAAREMCESYLDRSFVNTTWDYVFDGFPVVDQVGVYRGAILIPKSDLASVTSVTYLDTAGDSQTLVQGTDYGVLTGTGGAVYPLPGQVWPSTDDERHGSVTIRFVAGYGSSASNVPAAVKHAILMTIGSLYEHRGDGPSELPDVAIRLLGSQRWGTL